MGRKKIKKNKNKVTFSGQGQSLCSELLLQDPPPTPSRCPRQREMPSSHGRAWGAGKHGGIANFSRLLRRAQGTGSLQAAGLQPPSARGRGQRVRAPAGLGAARFEAAGPGLATLLAGVLAKILPRQGKGSPSPAGDRQGSTTGPPGGEGAAPPPARASPAPPHLFHALTFILAPLLPLFINRCSSPWQPLSHLTHNFPASKQIPQQGLNPQKPALTPKTLPGDGALSWGGAAGKGSGEGWGGRSWPWRGARPPSSRGAPTHTPSHRLPGPP